MRTFVLLLATVLLAAASVSAASFQLSNTLGDHMVLQRAPASAVVFGFADPGVVVRTTFNGTEYQTTTTSQGVWRQALPPTQAGGPYTISFSSSDGDSAQLLDVLFGEVFFCGGQSNCQMTMDICNNATAEIASANSYPNIRVFTVGQGTSSNTPLTQLGTIAQKWTSASSSSIGGPSWGYFSGLCWLFGKSIYQSLGGNVPVGLVSNNWGGTSIQQWCSASALKACNGPAGSNNLFNAMINPYVQGPMAAKGMIWYQGESNVGQASYYSCQFPVMIDDYRKLFKAPNMYFGFVQISGYNYGTDQSPAYLREAQLSALQLPNVGLASAVDVGMAFDIHPTDKQTLADRLVSSALAIIYGSPVAWLSPIIERSIATVSQTTATVQVFFRQGTVGTGLTLTPPSYALAVQSNVCVNGLDPRSCGWPTIFLNSATGPQLNATITLASDGQSIFLQAPLGSNPPSSTVWGTSYGSASWPINLVWNSLGLPVIPWSNVTISQ